MNIFKRALGTLRNTIGEDVTFKGDGGLSETVKGVFCDQNVMLDLETFSRVVSNEPHVLIKLSDLSREPAQGDLFEIRSTDFLVGYVEKDGEGGAKVILREKLGA